MLSALHSRGMAAGLPTISIVTPSYNQGRFLREAIESVRSSAYPHIEHVVVDGGSTDESAAILRECDHHLAWWVSEPDQGQYDAINKGFARTSGEVMAWLNSDDKYMPWALELVGEIFGTQPEVDWLTTFCPVTLDERGRATRCTPKRFDRHGFRRGANLPGCGWLGATFLQQESTFWRRRLWERAGGRVDASLRLAGDFDLWARFAQHAELYGVETPLAGFRYHGEQKTSQAYDAYLEEARRVFLRYESKLPGRWQATIRSVLERIVPNPLRPWGTWLGLVTPVHVCRHRLPDGPWGVVRI
jgi:glycosyltransferase involved in cell wall biosynthesis